MIDRKRLRELAMAATPGPWHEGTWPDVVASDPRETIVCEATGAPANEIARADRTYIAAANPQTVLALLDALETQPPTDDERDAARYRWLRGNLFALESDYGSGDDDGIPALIFKWVPDIAVGNGRALDTAIDRAAIAERTKEQG